LIEDEKVIRLIVTGDIMLIWGVRMVKYLKDEISKVLATEDITWRVLKAVGIKRSVMS